MFILTNNEILSLVKAGFTAEHITKMLEREQPAPETKPAPTPETKPAPAPETKPAPTPEPTPAAEPSLNNVTLDELLKEVKSLKNVMQLRNAGEVSFLNPNNENKITTAGITADLIGGEI